MNAVLPLQNNDDVARIGEKAYRLSRMRQMGWTVPSGFVIPNGVFSDVLQQDDLGQRIDEVLKRIDWDVPQSGAEGAAEIAELVRDAPLPPELIEQVAEQIPPLLALGPIVVRSSACGEDSVAAAFAGQLDSFLNVRSLEAATIAIRNCWASYWSHRSLAYQRARRVSLRGMAVVVQHQVPAVYAGVLFTRDPRDSQADGMVTEYCEGLADQLVSGAITPRSQDLKRGWEGGHGDQRLLPSDIVGQLLNIGESAEFEFGGPQDIEWAADASHVVHIVQSRPITTLPAAPVAAAPVEAATDGAVAEDGVASEPCESIRRNGEGRTDPEGKSERVIWSNANVNENFPEPVSPLLYSIVRVGYYHYFRNLGRVFGVADWRIDLMEPRLRQIVGAHGGRIYYNLTNIHAVLRAAPCGEFLANAFNQFVGSEATPSNTTPWSECRRSRIGQAWELQRIARRAWFAFRSLPKRIVRFERRVDTFAQDSHPDKLVEKSSEELGDLMQRFMAIRKQWTDASLADAASMISYSLTSRFLAAEFTAADDQRLANRLLSGLCDLVSGLPTDHLWELSRKVRADADLEALFAEHEPHRIWLELKKGQQHREFYQEIRQFLERWGYRCSGELMLTMPSYQEDPAALLQLVQAFVQHEGRSPAELLREQEEQREVETARVLQQLGRRRLAWWLPWPSKRFIAKRLVRWTQGSVGFRERARLKQALLYTRLRRVALEIGSRLHDRRLLSSPDDIFFLTFDEIGDLLAGASVLPRTAAQVADCRRAAHAELSRTAPPDRLELAPGENWFLDAGRSNESDACPADDPTIAVGGGPWSGTGVCGGSIVGRAVVLTDPTQLNLVQEGDILVTRQTDPGWGPILFLVRGLVMERGGMLSHGAILAREFGIPSVVDVPLATQQIRTGQTIRVQGDRGLVEALD